MTNFQSIKKWANLLGEPLEYSKVQVKPVPVQLLTAVIRHPTRWRSLIRTFNATRLPNGSLPRNDNLPVIEALIVSTEKDFGTIGHVLTNLSSGSYNKVNKVTIITPEISLDKCIEISSNFQHLFTNGVEIKNEDDFFDEKFRLSLQNTFNSRYGWVLQQLLTMEFVFNSNYSGVLTINSDTVLVQPRTWLDESDQQTMLVSTEFHGPYYHFLNQIFGTPTSPKYTFITHHMLMQPKYLRNVLRIEGILNVEELGNLAIQFADKSLTSPVCLEFEVYGQLMTKHYPEMLNFRKFANIGISLAHENLQFFVLNQIKKKDYYSVSFHSYLELPN
jgi:hypothetical protein